LFLGINFKRLLIKKREEIITSKLKVNLENTGEYLEPEELKELLDNKEDLLLVDARNEYEYEVGSFVGAINPKIDVFTEFPKLAKELEEKKNKTIVTFCTGGVRCEKASAYLKEQGFEKVYQLHGGIIRYGEEVIISSLFLMRSRLKLCFVVLPFLICMSLKRASF
jgi:UPF0176 protein